MPEDCPIKEIVKQLSVMLKLYEKILEHCDRCVKGK
ncbi:hypothetical protein ES703_04108 [subsurface metagenome]